MAKEVINVRLPEGMSIDEIDNKANLFGLSRSAYITRAVEVFQQFDAVSFARIEKFARDMDMPVGVVLQNTIIKRLATMQAEADVWGKPKDILMQEFAYKEENGKKVWIVGDELFMMHYNPVCSEEKREMLAVLLKEEALGIPLNAEQTAILIENRAGQAWMNSEQYKKEQEDLAAWVKEHGPIEDHIKAVAKWEDED